MFNRRCSSFLAAAALFASAGTFAIAAFWIYLAIFAAIFVASFLWLDPDLARERMRPGGRSRRWRCAVFRRPVAALDHRRARPRPLPLERYGAAMAPGPGPCSRWPAATRFALWAMSREPVLFLGHPHPVRPRPIRGHDRTLRGHSPSGLHGRHRHHAGERRRARLLACGGVPGDHHAAVSAVPRDHRRTDSFKPSFRAIATMPHACAGGLCRAFGERRQGFSLKL